MIKGYELAEERRALAAAYFTYWALMPYMKPQSRITPEVIAKPFVRTKQRAHEELLLEKEYYMQMMQEGG